MEWEGCTRLSLGLACGLDIADEFIEVVVLVIGICISAGMERSG